MPVIIDGTTGITTPGETNTGNLSVAGTTTLTTVLGAASGGTGAATLTANNVLLGNGTSAVQFVAPGNSGNVLTSNGTTWTSAVGAAPTYTQLATGSIANGTTNVDIETGFTNTAYTDIVIAFSNCKATGGSGYFTSQFKIGGSYNTTSNYAISKFASGEADSNLTAQSQMLMGFQGVRNDGLGADAVFIVKNRFQRQAGSGVITCLMPRTDNSNQVGMWWGYLSVAGDIQGVRFFITSSTVNFASGTYTIYGANYA
jgi:hypothetical protein